MLIRLTPNLTLIFALRPIPNTCSKCQPDWSSYSDFCKVYEEKNEEFFTDLYLGGILFKFGMCPPLHRGEL